LDGSFTHARINIAVFREGSFSRAFKINPRIGKFNVGRTCSGANLDPSAAIYVQD
jgi:hypothetical protein